MRIVLRKLRLLRVDLLFAFVVDKAVQVVQPNIFLLNTEFYQEVEASNACSSAAVMNALYLTNREFKDIKLVSTGGTQRFYRGTDPDSFVWI